MTFTHVIVGGGSAGCVLAARLSEDSRNSVLLIEAGENFAPDAIPDDILDVRLADGDKGAGPDICFNWLEDERDLLRLSDAFVRIAAIYGMGDVPQVARDPFAASFSDKVRNIGRRTLRNKVLTETAGFMMDNSTPLRRFLIENYMSSRQKISDIVADRETLHRHVREASSGLWHPSGTCRMGAADDPTSVVDPNGRVIGLENLYVADASIMPEIPAHNLNIPSIMIGERIADLQRHS